MDIKSLKYFVEIANQQSMTKATRKLHVSQPALSKQMQELERVLGQKLFNRSNHSITLTPEGDLLYKRALDIISLFDKTKKEFKSMKEFKGGDLHLGCAESYGISIISEIFKSFKSKYENARFNLYSGNFNTVTHQLNSGQLDFAITVQNMDTAAFNSLNLPYFDKWGILMKKDCELSKKATIELNDLQHLPIIISRQGITEEMPNELKNMQTSLNIVGTYDLIFNASIFVKSGLGYALCFDKLVDTSLESELVFKAITPNILSPMKIIWSNNQLLSKTAELFLEELKQSLKSL